MKPLPRLLLLVALTTLYPLEAAGAASTAQIEFLWSSTPNGALARAEAYGFVLEGNQDHRVCVVAFSQEHKTRPLRIEVIDASGALVDTQIHEDFTGPKQCYKAELGASEAVGEWTFNVYMNHKLAASKAIEVARTLKDASFYSHPSRPYVLGRPNYDPMIPAGEYIGRIVWIMHVDETGKVDHAQVESTEGAGNRMRDRAVAAGLLTMFPPDPTRTSEPLKVRQEYLLRAD
jgi:hypothetical protein